MSSWGLDYIIAHTGIWVNIFVILAIIALVAVIVYFILRRRKMVKMEKELEDLLEEKYEREGSSEYQRNTGTESTGNGMPEYK